MSNKIQNIFMFGTYYEFCDTQHTCTELEVFGNNFSFLVEDFKKKNGKKSLEQNQ